MAWSFESAIVCSERSTSTPAVMLSRTSYGSSVRPASSEAQVTVTGISCMTPTALVEETARWYHPDSNQPIARASLGSTPCRVAIERIRSEVSVRLGTVMEASLPLLAATARAQAVIGVVAGLAEGLMEGLGVGLVAGVDVSFGGVEPVAGVGMVIR